MLKQLVAYVGRDSFFAGIRAYLAEHAWGNATLADLLRALEASSGRSLADWSRAWLETAGPEHAAHASSRSAPDGAFTSFAVLQEAPAEHPTLRPHHIAIGPVRPAPTARSPGPAGSEVDVDGRAHAAVPRAGRRPRSPTWSCSTTTTSATRWSGSTRGRWPR